jgi:hypothetical protein
MNTRTQWASAATLILSAASAHAALIAVDEGKIVDNTVNNTMWIADGDLFATLATASGDPAAFVQTVIKASGGVIYDTPNDSDTPAYSGKYSLTAEDLPYGSGLGLMDWYGAKAFIIYLNSIKYLGYADWRLPRTADSTVGFPTLVGKGSGDSSPAAGELAELFYTELGGVSNSQYYPTTLNASAKLFHNLSDGYHYGTESLGFKVDGAWVFNSGYVAAEPKVTQKGYYATMVVRTGQASSKELITSVQGDVVTGADPLAAAMADLHLTCIDLTKFVHDSSTSGGTTSDAALKLDVRAIAAAIGCTNVE